MRCPKCKGTSIKTVSIVEDDGDVEQTVCAREGCGWILKEEKLVEGVDGQTKRRQRPVKEEDQPEEIKFPAKGEKLEAPKPPEEKLLTAQELMEKAIYERETKTEEEVRNLKREIIKECASDPTAGKCEFKIGEDEIPAAEVIKRTAKELRGLGYTVNKMPKPGEGLWMIIKWPTNRPKKKKQTKKVPEPAKKKQQPKQKQGKKPAKKDPYLEKIGKEQRGKAKHRQEALKNRSDLPS